MKKIFVKIIVIVLSILFVFNSVGCNSTTEENTKESENKENTTQDINNDSFKDTEYYIVQNGKSDYKIVIGNDCGTYVKSASQELNQFFKQATNIDLPIVEERDVNFDSNSKFIVLGENTFSKNANVTVDVAKQKTTGYCLKTVGKSIFIVGGSDVGTLYATYDFLYAILGYRYYAVDEIYIRENVNEIVLKDYDFSFTPSIEERQTYCGDILANNEYAMRMKNVLDSNLWVKVQGRFVHTFEYLLSPDKYLNEHPEWFSGDGLQPCLSQGLEDEEMFNIIYENVKKYVNAAPNAKYISVSQNDKDVWCTCEKCTAAKERYGSNLGIMIQFANKVAIKLKEDYPNRELFVQCFSYHQTSSAITDHFDEVQCEPNVTVMFAPIRANWTAGFTNNKKNEATLATLVSLSKVCSHITLWGYDVWYPETLLFYNTMNGRQDRFEQMEKYNVAFYFEEGQITPVQTAFSNLKVYLTSNLTWNNNLNQDELINDYFEHYFKDASTEMKAYFDELNAWTLYATEELGMNSDCNSGGYRLDTTLWPRGTVLGFQKHIDNALKSIEYLKYSDFSMYQKLYDRIILESLSVRYILIELWSSLYSDAELLQMKLDFKADATRLNLSQYKEGGSISTLYSSWGV